MRKRFIAIVVGILLLFSTVLTGCQFLEHNYQKDYGRVVATIAPVVDGAFNSGERYIYKYDLVEAANQQFANAEAAPTEDDINDVLDYLVDNELLYIEVERMIETGIVPWRGGDGDWTDENKIKKAKYDSIDQQLRSIQKTILTGYEEELPAEDGQTTEPASPTYPVRDPEENDEEIPEEKWDILTKDPARIPHKFGSPDKLSLEAAALAQFADQIVKSIEDGYKNYGKAYDKDALEAAKKDFRDLIGAKKYEELYLKLHESYPIEFLVGKNIRRQVQLEAVQNYLTKGVEVTDAEVEARYDVMLNTQKTDYADASKYSPAVSGTDLILYRPNSDYFYVKHVLVPFSEAQTAKLTAFKAKPNVTKAEITEYRGRLVDEIVAYPHPDGNEDLFNPTTAQAVFNEIRAGVSAAGASQKEAERKFDDFIYLYNTDPGAFTATSGYAVNKSFDKNNRTYMEEFELGAEDLYKNYEPGQVLPYPVVTDYGVHIMYYASDTQKGSVKLLRSFETPAEYKIIFDVIEEEIRTTKEEAIFGNWSEGRVNALRRNKELIQTFERRYKDLYPA